MKPVPMDPDKMTAGISFVNVGQNAIVSVELDFLDSSNISAVRDNPEKGIKIDMELGPGKTEDHLVLFNVSKLFLKGCSQFPISQLSNSYSGQGTLISIFHSRHSNLHSRKWWPRQVRLQNCDSKFQVHGAL